MAMRRLACRVHRDSAIQDVDRLVRPLGLDQPVRESLDGVTRRSPQTVLRSEDPFVENRFAKHEPIEELTAIERNAARELVDVMAARKAFELADVSCAKSEVKSQRIAARGDQRTVRAPDLRKGLSEIVAGALVPRLAP
jgi:hypothetical protein